VLSGRAKKKEAGFTLIELLIVVAIIGAFLMVAFPNYKSAVANAYSRSCEANQRLILTALEAYAIENGNEYPPAANALGELVAKGYLHEEPKCPAKGQYKVEVSSAEKKVTVTCDKHGTAK
jgi:prepilin-type N-terminal cleavage/methylation domain-containing protein